MRQTDNGLVIAEVGDDAPAMRDGLTPFLSLGKSIRARLSPREQYEYVLTLSGPAAARVYLETVTGKWSRSVPFRLSFGPYIRRTWARYALPAVAARSALVS